MPHKIKKFTVIIISSIVATNGFALSDFDNSDIPFGTDVSFRGGCGVVTMFEHVEYTKPRYKDSLPRPDSGEKRGEIQGGEFAQILSAIPGIGFLAAVVAGTASSIVANALINRQTEPSPSSGWDNTYKVTIKPDVGSEFTILYENKSRSAPLLGERVIVSSTGLRPDEMVQLTFPGPAGAAIKIGNEDYLEACYGNSSKKGKNAYEFRQLTYNGQEFEWKKLPPEIQSFVKDPEKKGGEVIGFN